MVAVRVLAANQGSDFLTVRVVQIQHLTASSNLFVQALQICQRVSLVTLGHMGIEWDQGHGDCLDAQGDT